MREKKTGKDSGRLLHAVRVSKFLQVAVLAAGVLGMSAASQSMTEISEKEQPLWQVWSAEECDAGLTVETVGENLILQMNPHYSLPASFSNGTEEFYITGQDNLVSLLVKPLNGRIRQYYSDYKSYDYLPGDD